MNPRDLRKERRRQAREEAKARRKAATAGSIDGAILELELPTGFRGGLILPLRVAVQLAARPFKWLKASIGVLMLFLVTLSLLGMLLVNVIMPWADPNLALGVQGFVMTLLIWFLYPFVLPPLLSGALAFMAGQSLSWRNALESFRMRTQSLIGLGFLSILMSGLTTAGIMGIKNPSLIWAIVVLEIFWKVLFGLAATWAWSYDLKAFHSFKMAWKSLGKTWTTWLGVLFSSAFLLIMFSNLVIWSARGMNLLLPMWQNIMGMVVAFIIFLVMVNACGLLGQLFVLLQSTAEEKIDPMAFTKMRQDQ